MEKLILIITLILALSIASERIVEIIKGLSQFLSKEDDGINPKRERRRRSWLQILSVGSALVTTFLAAPVLPESILPDMGNGTSWISLLALGLLASGGSSLWNGILTYVLKIKDLKSVDLKTAQSTVTKLQEQINQLRADIQLKEAGRPKV